MISEQYKHLVLHSGEFHPDDVMCAAVLQALFSDIDITRVQDERQVTDAMKNDPYTIVCDVGKEYDPSRKLYDHHNECSLIEGTDIKKAAIGLMLEDDVVKNAIFEKNWSINEKLQETLDIIQKIDNGKASMEEMENCVISNLISNCNPTWDSKEDSESSFKTIVGFVKENFVIPMFENGCLSKENETALNNIMELREQEQERAREKAQETVRQALKEMENNIVVLPQSLPWQDVLCPSEAVFVIFPSDRGGYALQCVPPEPGSFDQKLIQPDWSQDKPEGLTFQYPGSRFFSAFETQDQAIKAANDAVDKSLNAFIEFVDSRHDVMVKIDERAAVGFCGDGWKQNCAEFIINNNLYAYSPEEYEDKIANCLKEKLQEQEVKKQLREHIKKLDNVKVSSGLDSNKEEIQRSGADR